VIRRGVKEIISHENYDKNDKNYRNDIALVRLDQAVPLYLEDPKISGAKPICLPWNNNGFGIKTEDFDGATVAGWGRTTRKRNRISQMNLLQNKVNVENLQKLLVPVVNDQCTKSNSRVKIDPRIQLCAGGDKEKDSCSGDSGGPLFATEFEVSGCQVSYQIGLVSFGTNLCGRGIPGVYTKVAAYLPWIESKMEV